MGNSLGFFAHMSEFESDEELEPTWIAWFCGLLGNEFFVQVDEDYIQDDFNLTGLSSMVPYYEYAMDMILDCDSPSQAFSEEQQEMIETAAEMLYGLITRGTFSPTEALLPWQTSSHTTSLGPARASTAEARPSSPSESPTSPGQTPSRSFAPAAKTSTSPAHSARQTSTAPTLAPPAHPSSSTSTRR